MQNSSITINWQPLFARLSERKATKKWKLRVKLVEKLLTKTGWEVSLNSQHIVEKTAVVPPQREMDGNNHCTRTTHMSGHPNIAARCLNQTQCSISTFPSVWGTTEFPLGLGGNEEVIVSSETVSSHMGRVSNLSMETQDNKTKTLFHLCQCSKSRPGSSAGSNGIKS